MYGMYTICFMGSRNIAHEILFFTTQKYLTYLGISIILVLRRNYYYSCTGEEIVPSDELKFRVFKMIYMPTCLFYITT